MALLGSASPFDLLRRRLSAPAPARTLTVSDAARTLTAYEPPATRPAARPAEARLFRYEGLRRVETIVLWPEPVVAVPGLVYTWREGPAGRRVALWLDGDGVERAQERPVFRGLLARLLPAGWLVAAIDVRGIGETAPRPTGRPNAAVMGAEAFLTYESFVAGKPLLGMRLRDAACALEYLRSRPDADGARGAAVIGWGAGGLLALHLGALDEGVGAVATVETLASYRALVEHERYAHHVSGFVPGVVAGIDSPNGYELDDLAREMAPRRVLRLRSVDHLGQPLARETDEQVQQSLLAWLGVQPDA